MNVLLTNKAYKATVQFCELVYDTLEKHDWDDYFFSCFTQDYFGFKNKDLLRGDVIEAVEEAILDFNPSDMPTKKEFTQNILANPSIDFYDEFIVKDKPLLWKI